MPASSEETLLIARLEARIAALEAALDQRSRDLRLLQRHACKRDLIAIERLAAGLPPLPLGAFEPVFWQETTDLTQEDVRETLEDLWASLAQVEPAGVDRIAKPLP
ncbi:MAG TPA: hypothetical protein VHQ90_11050 [Thermoanaerobaculia bacterium]|nr:hypothetical protein [Thermoanaerobaculia bacterium]